MSRNQNLTALGVLIAIAAATMIWLQLRSTTELGVAAPAAPTAPSAKPTESAQGAPPAAKPRVRRMENPAGRAELLRQIRDVRAKRTPPGSSPTPPTAKPALPEEPTLQREYIREAMRELVPLLHECYEQGLERDMKLGGSIVVDFTIEGEPEVGGVIGESAIDPDASTLTDPAVRECVQETMFGLEIDPPAGGGVVKVHYPFDFSVASSE